MDVFPVEIHSYICELACTDGGYTARSLGLVSKYFREVVHPYRYQSIAVSGQIQISGLERRLVNPLPHLRRVRNIFISDGGKDDEQGVPIQRSAPHITLLLGLVCSSVEKLTLHCDDPRTSTSLLAFLFGLHYPHLRELTVVGYYPFPHIPNAMPRLRYLHLNGNRNPHGLLQMGSLDVACPELTHLRISGLSRAAAFAAELAEALTRVDSRQALFNAKLPSNIRHIVVQPGVPTPVSGKFASARLSDDCMMEQLGNLVEDGKNNSGVRFTLLKRRECGDIAATSRRLWMDSLEGREKSGEVSA
ncbi:hypothetical protein PILCRDRAFT_7032 [Piloderma croceum F 1598]|uniref:F-box domain-containing protein n=1 Tax=Piloderma croceum (strain F 1598) TaxID=765440 RepID=A0A0C3BBG9_PILCF|nr:hypothetical protein PILCRDRAFT_7032 [Piloderma croceum F 1598]